MGLVYDSLNLATRAAMKREIEADRTAGTLYLSDNLNEQGKAEYPQLLLAAADGGSDDSLANQLFTRLNSHEKPRTNSKTGAVTTPKMRANAHTMLAEGEFNHYYMRAVCIIALEKEESATVTVCRAKVVEEPRPNSAAKIGTKILAKALLADLRSRSKERVATHLGPSGPNSGLTVQP